MSSAGGMLLAVDGVPASMHVRGAGLCCLIAPRRALRLYSIAHLEQGLGWLDS